jgi:type VI protein secretion system component Hcp
MRRYCRVPRRGILGLLATVVVLTSLLLTAAGADAAYTVGPFELNGGGAQEINVPALLSVQQGIIGHPAGSQAYGSGGAGAPSSVSELTITKKVDQSSSALLGQAIASGRHWKTGALTLQTAGSPYEALCLTDPFGISRQTGGGASGIPTETVEFGYWKLTVKYGAGANCGGATAPPVVSSLVRLNSSASRLTARVDCLIANCRGILAVSLPNSACPKVASPSAIGGTGGRGSQCSFTGGVRVGLGGAGKVFFNGDGTAITGGVKIGINGAGKFGMGDGSVRVLNLTVPPPLRKWLKGHSHATLGSIIVVRGLGRAIVQREVVNAPAKLDASVPSLTATEPGGNEVPPLTPQSLVVTECSTPVVGTPTVVTVNGTLSPPRGGAAVSLTYTPINGPMPLPSPIVDSVTTTATGNFAENFDRRREGKDYSWNVVAAIPAGNGYAAASSPACAVPIP